MDFVSIAGIDSPRAAKSGNQLPNSRMVSMVIHDDIDVPSDVHTLFMMYFGQFTDHDLSRTAISKLTVDEQGWSPFFFMYVSYIPHCTIILTTFRYSHPLLFYLLSLPNVMMMMNI